MESLEPLRLSATIAMDAMDVDGPSGAHPRSNLEDSSASNQEVGVGIVFQPLDDGTLYVKRLKEGEPAARSGLIKVSPLLAQQERESFVLSHIFTRLATAFAKSMGETFSERYDEPVPRRFELAGMYRCTVVHTYILRRTTQMCQICSGGSTGTFHCSAKARISPVNRGTVMVKTVPSRDGCVDFRTEEDRSQADRLSSGNQKS